MPMQSHNPPQVFPPYTNYSHAIEVAAGSRLLFLSGLNGYLQDGQTMPETFEEQGNMIWTHMGAILEHAGMSYSNLVSVRTYLAHPMYDEANMALRSRYLGDHKPSLTVVVAGMLLPNWKLEVEAIAAE
ncbi:MAG: RidA family protein [Chloroflexota bacterium]